MSDVLEEIRDAYEYDSTNWQEIRKEAKLDMQFVAGNPWNDDDKKQRKDRPMVAPEEMGQYFNQVINSLRANPRGARFSPVGNGANDKTAEFYQNKWREVEYRSHAKIAYVTAAENAIHRSYGFLRVNTRYSSPRSANQDIWIEAMPNPDMVLPDSDALSPDSSDMKRCFVYTVKSHADFKRDHGKDAKVTNLKDWGTTLSKWVMGDKVVVAEYWRIVTKERKLMLVEAPAMPGAARQQVQVFEDELAKYPGMRVVRQLRKVDFPTVKMCLTNGIEVLSDETNWVGKYIPIVSCYGKVLYVEGDTGMERKMLSMTRFGRDPWKCYCYACCQELEVLGMVPKSPLMIPRGSMNTTELRAVEESMHTPKAYLLYGTEDGNGRELPAPQRAEYVQAQYLQAVEMSKEGYRRAIQAAMGSNFMPTQAQRRNEKSGIALEKIEQAASQGTYHFVNSYEDMIRHTAVIGEDLMDKIHDYRGDVDVIEADGKAKRTRINDPQDQDAISTRGDHVVTISTSPSSDSERQAAEDFTDTLVANLQMIAAVSGQKAAAAVLARSVRMRNLGAMGDQLADIIEPEEYKQKDGKPPSPEVMALQAENQQLKSVLQQAEQEKQAKVVEQRGKYAIEQMKAGASSADKAADREVKLAVAELGAKMDRLSLFLEERARVGAQIHDASEGTKNRLHDVALAAMGHRTAQEQAQQAHDQNLEAGAQGVAGQMAVAEQSAALQPPADSGAEA